MPDLLPGNLETDHVFHKSTHTIRSPATLEPVASECDICLDETINIKCSFCSGNVCKSCMFEWWNAVNKTMLYKCCTCKQRGFFRLEVEYNSMFLFPEEEYVPVQSRNVRTTWFIYCILFIMTTGLVALLVWLICSDQVGFVVGIVAVLTCFSVCICLSTGRILYKNYISLR
jgi:hypothetical protein